MVVPEKTVEQLEEEHERLSLVLESSQLGIWDWNLESGSVEIDRRWAEMLGYHKADLTPFTIKMFNELCHPDDRQIVEKAIADHTGQATSFYRVEIRLRSISGQYVFIQSTGKVTERNNLGEAIRMTGIHEDISKQVEQRISGEIARSQLQAAQRIGGLGSWYLDVATNEETWSEELFRLYGLNPGKHPPPASEQHKLFATESWQRLSEAISETKTSGAPYELELELSAEGRSRGWIMARGEAIRNPMGELVGILGVAVDITSNKSKETALENQAFLDPLTQLGNRASLEMNLDDAVGHSLQTNQPFAVLMVDIDHFKEINDVFGHETGDEALISLAERLKSSLRNNDQIFRMGGDEFLVLMRNSMSAETSLEIAERVCLAFRRPLLELEKPLTATVSVGLVRWDMQESPKQLLRRADEALYKAKSLGRNQVFFPTV